MCEKEIFVITKRNIELEERCNALEKALDKTLYKWITHEDPALVKGNIGYIASVKRTIAYNKEQILKEVNIWEEKKVKQ